MAWPGDGLGGVASLSDGSITLSMLRRDCTAVYKLNGRLIKEFISDGRNHAVDLSLPTSWLLCSYLSFEKES